MPASSVRASTGPGSSVRAPRAGTRLRYHRARPRRPPRRLSSTARFRMHRLARRARALRLPARAVARAAPGDRARRARARRAPPLLRRRGRRDARRGGVRASVEAARRGAVAGVSGRCRRWRTHAGGRSVERRPGRCGEPRGARAVRRAAPPARARPGRRRRPTSCTPAGSRRCAASSAARATGSPWPGTTAPGTDGAAGDEARAAFASALHDRMTEAVLDDEADAARLFATEAPRPLESSRST